ncbi:MAG: class I SAM-dependent methyltransferase [Bdellovibrionaceae bacterium]|nr:class I SAM-dependent methyltransferase [Pseudobdellovibrionaceae bacterium]
MNPLRLCKILYSELTAKTSQERIPETDLVMTDVEAVEAFASAGNGTGIMAPYYQFALERIARALPAHGTVIDLGCGSGALLIPLAELFPRLQFIGIDLSENMLNLAKAESTKRQLKNVTFLRENFSRLSPIADNSIDFVYCSMAIHHLPTVTTLDETCQEVGRVLASQGGFFLVDFGRLKSDQAIRLFIDDAPDGTPQVLLRDYDASMRAAFSLDEWRKALQPLRGRNPKLMTTFGAPFIVGALCPHPTSQTLVLRALHANRSRLSRRYFFDYLALRFLFKTCR